MQSQYSTLRREAPIYGDKSDTTYRRFQILSRNFSVTGLDFYMRMFSVRDQCGFRHEILVSRYDHFFLYVFESRRRRQDNTSDYHDNLCHDGSLAHSF